MAVIQRVGSPAKPRKWMSVHEMGEMLGLKKTDRYWLVHKNYFRTETLLGKMRVEIASFEKWYANQDWYHSQSRYRHRKTEEVCSCRGSQSQYAGNGPAA